MRWDVMVAGFCSILGNFQGYEKIEKVFFCLGFEAQGMIL